MLIRVYRLDMLLHKICNHYLQHNFNLKHLSLITSLTYPINALGVV